MTNEDGSIWIIHNGEVYNYLEIRKELEAMNHYFKSMTDTEVIIHAYEEWGIDCLESLQWHVGICIWDSKKRQLFCARDRAGVKPFYYIFDGKRFAFASEIKALLTLEDLDCHSQMNRSLQIIFFQVFSIIPTKLFLKTFIN